MNCSGYPYIPCSEMSSPASSSASLTRRPMVSLISQNIAKLRQKTNVNATAKPLDLRRPAGRRSPSTRARPSGSPNPLYWASRGEVKIPHESVPQMPARPCAESAPTGSSMNLSIARTPKTTITPATAPMIGAAQNST